MLSKSTVLNAKILIFSQVYYMNLRKECFIKNRSIKHKVNDEFEYKQFVTVLRYCFVFRQGLSIP